MIDICVAVYNKFEYTRQFINNVNMYAGIDYHFYIVDDCSTDKTKDYLDTLSKDRFTIIRNEKNIGYLLSINKALAETKSNYILIANNDILICKDCFKILEETIKEKNIWCLSPNVILGISSKSSGFLKVFNPQNSWKDFVNEFDDELKQDKSYSGLYGCCFLITRECYETIGGFDERYILFWFEDVDYLMRLKEINRDSFITKRAYVYHYENTSLVQVEVEKRGELYEQNRIKFRKKWRIN